MSMPQPLKRMTLFVVLGWCGASDGFAASTAETEQAAQATIASFQAKDQGMKVFFSKSYGYAVCPSVKKAGLGIGGARGKGILFQQGQSIGEATVTQFTVGFQAGAQAYSEDVFFEDKKALNDFKIGNFEFSAQVSAVAVTAGASANAAYDGGVAVFTMTLGGLMYEASVGGQKFKFKPAKRQPF